MAVQGIGAIPGSVNSEVSMRRLRSLWRSTVGKKAVMAVTGLINQAVQVAFIAVVIIAELVVTYIRKKII